MPGRKGGPSQNNDDTVKDIFTFSLTLAPRWLVEWGADKDPAVQDQLHHVANGMWKMGCATTITAIWRWNVDRVHHDGTKTRTLPEAVQGCKKAIREAYIPDIG